MITAKCKLRSDRRKKTLCVDRVNMKAESCHFAQAHVLYTVKHALSALKTTSLIDETILADVMAHTSRRKFAEVIPEAVAPRRSDVEEPRFKNDFRLHTAIPSRLHAPSKDRNHKPNPPSTDSTPFRAQAFCHDEVVPIQPPGLLISHQSARIHIARGVDAVS